MEISSDEVIHQFDSKNMTQKISLPFLILILVVAAALGGGAGYLIKSFSGGTSSSISSKTDSSTKTTSKKSEGVLDKKRFPDEVEGKLQEGGVEGEGSFHLERPGGESQNVYLTSSTVDLGKYVGKKVKVLGETQKAQKAGWLMDVGYIEVL